LGITCRKCLTKTPGSQGQDHLKNQQNCKKRKPWFQEKRRKHSETKNGKLEKGNKKKQKGR